MLVGLIAEGNTDKISERRRTRPSTSLSSGVSVKSRNSISAMGSSMLGLSREKSTAPQWRQRLERIPVLSRQLQQLHIRVTGCCVGKPLIGHATHSLANVGSSLPVIDAWLPLVKYNSHARTAMINRSGGIGGRPALRVIVVRSGRGVANGRWIWSVWSFC